jgi:adenosylcobinamide-GDP ribazoletransferase
VRSFRAAVAFLTRIPFGRAAFETADVAHSAGWFPLIGVLLGIVYAGAAAAFKGHLPAAVIAVLLIILDALATGALHFDGLADTADGFGGGRNRDDTLRIMRDHAIGSYGGIALAAIVALKVTAYSALLSRSDWLVALILTPALGRWSILLLTATLPYARSSPSVVEGMGKRSLFWGSLLILAPIIAAKSWIAMAAVIAVTTTFGFYCRHRIAGITGDALGANVQICESAALLTFLWAGHAQ